MRKIVYIPLDERPCNYDFPYLLTEGSEAISLVRPSIDVMGKKKQPADCRGICEFLVRECRDADYLILALDTLLYGGIIPSRLHSFGRDELFERLDVLKEIKRANPDIRISAFSLVMRCPCYSDDAEEPDYYALCGKEIFLYGQNEHRFKLGEISAQEYEKRKRELSACFEYIGDYERRRAVNISLLCDSLNTVGTYIDEFTILQDDSNARGYTAMDRERVLRIVEERGIKLDTYPGADEAGLTLLARAAAYLENRRPTVCPVFPRAGAEGVVPIYEDREIYRTVSAQIESAGCAECSSPEDADILLFFNLNDTRTYDVYLSPTKQNDEGYIPELAARIADTIKSGAGVAVADVAYCNAGDLTFLLELAKKTELTDLWGYAGWNTSSNTIGTVMCQAVLRYLYGNTAAHRRFSALRIMDDVVYSADVRPELVKRAKAGGITHFPMTGEYTDAIVRYINDRTGALFGQLAERYEATECSLPWNRLFEIRLTVKER